MSPAWRRPDDAACPNPRRWPSAPRRNRRPTIRRRPRHHRSRRQGLQLRRQWQRPCCRATSSCARATRSSAPTAWSTTRRPASAKLDGRRRVLESRCSRCAAAAASIRRRSARKFEGAQFELPERNARGSARNMQVDANGKVTLDGVVVHHLPGQQVEDWKLKSQQHRDRHEQHAMARAAAPAIEFKGVPIIYLPWMTFSDRPDSARAASSFRASAARRATARKSWCLTTGTSGRTSTSSRRAHLLLASAAWISPASCVTSRSAQRGTLDFNYLPSDDIAGIATATRVHAGARRRPARRLALPHRRHGRRRQPTTSRISRTGPKAPACRSPNGSPKPSYRDEHWNVRAQVQDFQTIDEDLPAEDRPYARTPRVLASGDWDRRPRRDRLRISMPSS